MARLSGKEPGEAQQEGAWGGSAARNPGRLSSTEPGEAQQGAREGSAGGNSGKLSGREPREGVKGCGASGRGEGGFGKQHFRRILPDRANGHNPVDLAPSVCKSHHANAADHF